MKIIGVSNFDNPAVNDILIEENITNIEEGEAKVIFMNMEASENCAYWYTLVEDDYKLYVYEP